MKIALIVLACFMSCTIMKETSKISFAYHDSSGKQKVIMKIPKGSNLIKITAGGEGQEHRYWYKDSSVVYLSSLRGSATLNASLVNRDMNNYNKMFVSDTASFAGSDEKGNCWKEVKKGDLLYGYSNVPLSKKPIFDKAITSLR